MPIKIRMRLNFALIKKFAPQPPHDVRVSSLLVIPETAKERPPFGEVVAAGPGRWVWDKRSKRDVRQETLVRAGDIVVLPKYATGERVLEWYAEGDARVALEKYGVEMQEGEELIVYPDSVLSAVIEP